MNPKYHLLIAVAALSLGACSTDDTCTGPENEGYKLSFTVAEDSDTRTTLDAGDILRWVPTDKVGIYTVGQSVNSNIETTADVSKSPVEFAGTLKQMVSSGDMFYAYYPYDEAQSTDPTMVTLSIPVVQKQTKAGVYNGESHPLVAVPMELSQELSNAATISNVRFRQLGAIVELQLYSSDEKLRNEKIYSVTFESNTPLAGDFTFDLKTVTDKKELKISGYKSTEVMTSLPPDGAAVPATKNEAARIYLTIAPGQYTGNIYVETDAAQYTFCLNKVMTFERAVITGLPADLAEAERDGAVEKTDPIPFKDSTVKDICVKYWDTDQNGELSYEEAAAVTSIESEFMETSIRSFKEFRHFTGLKSIGDKAFYRCRNLTSITIPVKVATIGSQAFWGCSSLINVHIWGNMIEIGSMAFGSCSRLTNILIPYGVTKIRSGAFSGCSSLPSVTIPDGVTTIESDVFKDCSSLSSVTIPERVAMIEDYAFSGCSSLTYINIPERVTKIGWYAFDGCSSLPSITIPDGVAEIGWYAFRGCSSLTSINIPETVSSIGAGAFAGCSSLSAFYGKFASIDNRYLLQGVTLIAIAPAGLTEYTIPEDVIMIGNRAFEDCISLTRINIPEWVTSIGIAAFRGCSKLTSVYCKPTTPPTLDSSVFSNTPSTMKIYVPKDSADAYKAANNWSTYASQIVADNN